MDRLSITFGAIDAWTSEYAPTPVPAARVIPEWYHETVVYGSGGREAAPTLKRCAPLRDGLTAGYLLLLPVSVRVDRDTNGSPRFVGAPRSILSPVGRFPAEQLGALPIAAEFDATNAYKWVNPWTVRTPPGYSTMFTHPIGRGIEHFRTFTAIVDTDVWRSPVNLAFLLRQDYTGEIPAGTPIAQVIPFRREAWEHSVVQEDTSELLIEDQKFKRSWEAGYRDHYRQAKRYI